jgi:hypothetical protein
MFARIASRAAMIVNAPGAEEFAMFVALSDGPVVMRASNRIPTSVGTLTAFDAVRSGTTGRTTRMPARHATSAQACAPCNVKPRMTGRWPGPGLGRSERKRRILDCGPARIGWRLSGGARRDQLDRMTNRRASAPTQ